VSESIYDGRPWWGVTIWVFSAWLRAGWWVSSLRASLLIALDGAHLVIDLGVVFRRNSVQNTIVYVQVMQKEHSESLCVRFET
jgi:hypothetical protein